MEKFTKTDLEQLKELIFNALGVDLVTNEGILEIYYLLPTEIKKDFDRFGIGDTPTRDRAYVWLQSNFVKR